MRDMEPEVVIIIYYTTVVLKEGIGCVFGLCDQVFRSADDGQDATFERCIRSFPRHLQFGETSDVSPALARLYRRSDLAAAPLCAAVDHVTPPRWCRASAALPNYLRG